MLSYSKSETTVQAALSLQQLIYTALEQGDSVALWRLPNESVQRLIVCKSPRVLTEQDNLEDLAEGFIIAPFLPSQSATFLPADYYFRYEGGTLLQPSSPVEVRSHTWLHQQENQSITKSNFYRTPVASKSGDSKEDFIDLVSKSLELIEQDVAEKIVPSRTKYLDTEIDALESFDKLCERYPTAMVSLISTKQHGTWLGATPEVLVSIENNQIFKTVALAGTQQWKEGADIKSVAWTQKEIEEQALVERYIISCFKKIRLREYEEHGPKTVMAGNLMHLRSDFMVNMHEVNFPKLGSVMLKLLHPTSAVCGMPMEPVLDFLLTNEGYNRELYSGYLGPVNIEQNTFLFVNLRCMKVVTNGVQLYAGAGVTIDSVAEKEWKETELKMDTLQSVIVKDF